MAAGQAIGGALGGAAGTAIGGPMGAQVGLSLGSALGGMIDANQQKKKADSAFPDFVDPNQASYLAELNQKRKSIETGADFAEAVRLADQTQASTNDSIVKASGGDSGTAIQGLLQAQAMAGNAKNNAAARGQSQQFAYDGAYGNMLNQISARKLQLELLRSQQARAEWAQGQQDANQNANAGLANLFSVGGVGGGMNFPSNWSIGGSNGQSALSSLSGQPTINNTMMNGVAASTVVPQQNLATQSLGAVL